MRLWHYQLLEHLPLNQLLGQNRECAALMGAGWGRPHAGVNYVFWHSKEALARYWWQVKTEIFGRQLFRHGVEYIDVTSPDHGPIYPEHTDIYLSFCLHNLKYAVSDRTGEPKGIDLFDRVRTVDGGFFVDRGEYDPLEEYEYLGGLHG